MEKRLHPIFQNHSMQISEKFDPTPTTFTQNYSQNNKSSENSQTTPEIIGAMSEVRLKINRMAQKMANLEERLENSIHESRAHFSKVSGRLNEKSHTDAKIEALLERHNQVIHTFDKRMSQMAKMLEDSQAQLISTHGALEEARREIARMKRL